MQLMDPIEVRTNLEAVANRVVATDKEAATRLRDLSNAVGGGQYADAWAASNVFQLIEPDQVVARFKNQRITERIIVIIEWVRNSLIFAPLVVTWFGISQATAQYTTFIHANPTQITQPFLYLWQTGFGGNLPWWQTLSFLAGVDFILLLIVLGLTIWVYSMSSFIRQRREEEAEKLRSTLVHAIAGAVLCLTTRSWQQPTNFVDRFDKAIAHFDTIMAGLVGRVTALTDRQDKELQTFMTFKNDLDTTMKGVSTSMAELKSPIGVLASNVRSLSTPLQDISTKMGDLSQKSQEAVKLLNGQIGSLQGLLTKQEEWVRNLAAILAKLDQITNIGVGLAQKEAEVAKQQAMFLNTVNTQQTAANTQQTAFLDQVKNQRDAQKELANEVRYISQTVRDIISDLNMTAKELKGLNIQLGQMIRNVAAMRP